MPLKGAKSEKSQFFQLSGKFLQQKPMNYAMVPQYEYYENMDVYL